MALRFPRTAAARTVDTYRITHNAHVAIYRSCCREFWFPLPICDEFTLKVRDSSVRLAPVPMFGQIFQMDINWESRFERRQR